VGANLQVSMVLGQGAQQGLTRLRSETSSNHALGAQSANANKCRIADWASHHTSSASLPRANPFVLPGEQGNAVMVAERPHTIRLRKSQPGEGSNQPCLFQSQQCLQGTC